VYAVERFMPLLGIALLMLAIICPVAAHAEQDIRPLKVHLSPEATKGISKERVYISSRSSDEAKLLELRRILIERGVRHVNLFLPSILVFEDPAEMDLADLLSDPDFTIDDGRRLRESSIPENTLSPSWIELCYEKACRALPHIDLTGHQLRGVGFGGFRDTVLVIPRSVVKKIQVSTVSAKGTANDKKVDQNSEFLAGDILVQLIYPESNGLWDENKEDWTDRQLSEVISGSITAMLNFQEQFGMIPMHMVFRIFERVPTDFEPISHNMSDDEVWVKDTMRSLGYTIDDDLAAVHQFNNEGRKRYGTDWVFSAFIANSEHATNHRFNNAGYTAYAYLGGPYLVMPYPAGENPFGIDEILLFSNIFQHEAAHVFWALDEYLQAMGDCRSHSGYLDVYNRNKLFLDPDGNADTCQDIVPCIMARAKEDLGRPICTYTAGMLGLALKKNSGIPKIFDSPPIVRFVNSDVETVDTDDLEIRFRAISTAVRNENPFQPVEERIHYAAPLKDATFSVDGVGMVKLIPEDGDWDEIEEDLVIRLTSLPPGLFQIGVKVRNSAGRSSPVYIKKIFNVGLNYSHFAIDKREGGIHFSWNVVGENFGASIDLHRIDPDGRDRILVQDITPAGRLSEQFLSYAYFDTDVFPGNSYRYYLSGTFTIEFHGEVRTYTSVSPVLTAKARLPISKGSFVSYPSPNPFNPTKGKLVLSINVPSASPGIGGPGISQGGGLGGPGTAPGNSGEKTYVDVCVYDVLGRLVKRLQSETASSGILTIGWDGTNQNNQLARSGVYFIRIQAGSITQVRKLLLLR
jgi:hypothetical protein